MRIMKTGTSLFDQDLHATYQDHLENRDLAPATIRSYLHDLKTFRAWFEGIHEGNFVPLSQIGPIDLAAFRKHLIQEKTLKPKTVNRRIQSLRLFFRWLQEQGLILENPAKPLRFVRESTQYRPKALTPGEVLSLLRTAGCSPHGLARRNLALLQIMLQTGLRVAEVATLRQSDLILRERSGLVRVRLGKGLKVREIPLNTTARRALKAYLQTVVAISEHQVFLSKRGTPISVRSIQNIIASLAKRAGISRLVVSSHTLRHTFAVNYLKHNPDKLIELAGLLGHESLDTTAIYTRPSVEDVAHDLERSPLNVLGT